MSVLFLKKTDDPNKFIFIDPDGRPACYVTRAEIERLGLDIEIVD